MELIKLARAFEKMTMSKKAQMAPDEGSAVASYQHIEAQVRRMSAIISATLRANPGSLDLQKLDTVMRSWAQPGLKKDDIPLIRTLAIRGLETLSKYPNASSLNKEFNGLISQLDQEFAVIRNVSNQPLPAPKPTASIDVHNLPNAPKPLTAKPKASVPYIAARPKPNTDLLNSIKSIIDNDSKTSPKV
jgi:hypothetical protein